MTAIVIAAAWVVFFSTATLNADPEYRILIWTVGGAVLLAGAALSLIPKRKE